jgi:hypothetical protein
MQGPGPNPKTMNENTRGGLHTLAFELLFSRGEGCVVLGAPLLLGVIVWAAGIGQSFIQTFRQNDGGTTNSTLRS